MLAVVSVLSKSVLCLVAAGVHLLLIAGSPVW
jgi:hypothetical protein